MARLKSNTFPVAFGGDNKRRSWARDGEIINQPTILAHDTKFTIAGYGFGEKPNQKTYLVWRGDDGIAPNTTLGRKDTWNSSFGGALSTAVLGEGSTQSVVIDLGSDGNSILGRVDFDSDEVYCFRRAIDNFTEEEATRVRFWLDSSTIEGAPLTVGTVLTCVETGTVATVRNISGSTIYQVDCIPPTPTVYYQDNATRYPFGNVNGNTVTWEGGSGKTVLSPDGDVQVTFNNKIIRFWSGVRGSNNTEHNCYLSVLKHSSNLTAEHLPSAGTGTPTPRAYHIPKEWVHEEFELTQSSGVNVQDAKFFYWQNGVKFWHANRFTTSDTENPTKLTQLRQQQMSNGAQPGSLRYIDYLYVDTDKCRVLLSNSATLNLEAETSNTVKVFPLPISSWNDNEIEVYYQHYMPDWTHIHVVNAQGQLVKTLSRAEIDAAVQPTLLVREDFEDNNFVQGMDLSQAAVVTSNPYSGTRAARVNLKDNATDPLIATASYNAGNALAISNMANVAYRGQALVDANPPVRTVRWKFRFDDATWSGTSWVAGQGDRTLNLKTGYFWPTGYSGSTTASFFVAMQGKNGTVSFQDNRDGDPRGDAGWENSSWATRPGSIVFYLKARDGNGNIIDMGPGTGYHEFAIEVDSTHTDYNQVRLFVDGWLCKGTDYATDGVIRVPKTWRLEQFSTSYTGDNEVNTSTDAQEIACGIQYDEIEIWSGRIYN